MKVQLMSVILRITLVSSLALFLCVPMINASSSTDVASKTKIGSPCERNSDCGRGLHCIEDKETRNGAKFAGGYCVKFDCSWSLNCDAGSKCIEPEGANFSLCMASCSDDSHCRNGYACHEDGVCLPARH